jgi:hypothetical protein
MEKKEENMKRFLIVLALAGIAAQGYTQDKQADIRSLLEITEVGATGRQMMDFMVDQFKTMMPEVPMEYWDAFYQIDIETEMIEIIIPIYDRNFSHKEIKDIIAFYQTPSGQSLIKKQPIITKESLQAGQIWGADLGQRIQAKLLGDGYLQ